MQTVRSAFWKCAVQSFYPFLNRRYDHIFKRHLSIWSCYRSTCTPGVTSAQRNQTQTRARQSRKRSFQADKSKARESDNINKSRRKAKGQSDVILRSIPIIRIAKVQSKGKAKSRTKGIVHSININCLTSNWQQNIDQRSDGEHEYRLGYLYYRDHGKWGIIETLTND